jgi:hypothetical protein
VDAGRATQAGTRLRDRLHHHGRFGDAEAGATEFRRHGDAQPARFHHRQIKILREDAFPVAFQPVFVRKTRAVLQDRVPDFLLVCCERKIHKSSVPILAQ